MAAASQGFAATHWSVVLAAGDADPERRAAALEALCRTYWEPLYAYLRVRGHPVHDAQDLTQAFFAHILRANRLEHLEPGKGKFRSFLLKSLNHFLSDERDRSLAAKRGGGCVVVPLEIDWAEQRLVQDSPAARSPEREYDRRWASTVLLRAVRALHQEHTAAGKSAVFEALRGFLAHEGNAADYEQAGAQLEMRPGAVAVAVHRLRVRLRELIRAEIAHTVNQPAEIDDEMRYLLELVCQ